MLYQQDIRQVQLAKSAIRAGVAVLLSKLGISENDIQRILLAGAFGTYISRESAIRIGLLPDIAIDRIKFVGNAALSGAQLALISNSCREKAEQLSQKIEYIEIAHEKDFINYYTRYMLFPEA